VIVLDTSVLSLAFRRRRREEGDSGPVAALRKLIADNMLVAVPGIVLQELLSGVRSREQFRNLRTSMAGFPLLLASESHHVRAARISNTCRRRGVACSTTDALIAAISVESGGTLFTTDADFQRIASHCGLKLAKPPPEAQ
jgi:predicted nucleic acid-binding protein